MRNNSQCWVDRDIRKGKAQLHTAIMEADYLDDDIANCVENSSIYSKCGDEVNRTYSDNVNHDESTISIVPDDSVSAAFLEKRWGKKVCILNFASYKNPGGRFLDGSMAQEECLCHESFLYNVLMRFQSIYYDWNKKHLNRGLYLNRAIYSPNIMFEHNDQIGYFDVLTCAAPNYSVGLRYKSVSKEENSKALRSRIDFILSILDEREPDAVILGAWGCGVFKQNPIEVASVFKELIPQRIHSSMRIVFAIPDKDSKNYEAFQTVFNHSE